MGATPRGAIGADWKWEESSSKPAGSSARPERFVLILHNPAADTALVTLPEKDGRRAGTVWVNDKAHTGKVEIRQPGETRIEGEY